MNANAAHSLGKGLGQVRYLHLAALLLGREPRAPAEKLLDVAKRIGSEGWRLATGPRAQTEKTDTADASPSQRPG